MCSKEKGGEEGLQQSFDSQLLHSVPALQLFTSNTASSCPSSPPFSLEHTVFLQPHIYSVVSTLHMVYEVHMSLM